jgi:hypothetical protein
LQSFSQHPANRLIVIDDEYLFVCILERHLRISRADYMRPVYMKKAG